MPRIHTASLKYASLAHILQSPGITVIETPEFISRARGRMSDKEREKIIRFLSLNPDAGEIMTGTGGARKIRFAGKGRGKRGGLRVIYFYYNDTVPLFIFTVFSKNEKINLTQSERNDLKKTLKNLVKEYRKE